jgi:hypothetical protein
VVNKPEEQKYRSLKIAAVVDKLKAVEAAIDVITSIVLFDHAYHLPFSSCII